MTVLTVTIKENTLLLTLNRPAQRNALNAELIHAIQSTLAQYHGHKTIRTVILQGAGEHFCAGADIKEMQALQQATDLENKKNANQLAELLWQLYTFPKPVIALVQGSAIGGGIGLLAASDIVLATKETMFSFSEVKLGLVPAIISPYVAHAIGTRAMRRYFLTAERFNADIGHQLGLIHEIVINNTLLDAGLSFANLITHNGPEAIKTAKHLIATIINTPFDEATTLQMADVLANIRQTAEAREGFHAFTEKRLPKWS